jgi:hypothetical protein
MVQKLCTITGGYLNAYLNQFRIKSIFVRTSDHLSKSVTSFSIGIIMLYKIANYLFNRISIFVLNTIR